MRVFCKFDAIYPKSNKTSRWHSEWQIVWICTKMVVNFLMTYFKCFLAKLILFSAYPELSRCFHYRSNCKFAQKFERILEILRDVF